MLSLKAVSEAQLFAPSALQSAQAQEGVSLLDVQWRFWTELRGKGWDEERGLPVWKVCLCLIVILKRHRSLQKKTGSFNVFTKRSWSCFFSKNAGLA